MKKSTLLKIYKELNMTKCLTNYLYKLSDLKSDAEYIFLDFCHNHKYIIDEENIEYLMQISSSLCSIKNLNYRQKLIDNIDNMLENDYIVSSIDFDNLLENIIYTLTIDTSSIFYCEEDDDNDYYITEILCKLIKGLCNCSKVVKENLYSHDIKKIIENYFSVLEELNITKGDRTESDNFNKLKRLDLYLDIVFNKEIFEMSDKKYKTVVDIAKTIEDNSILSSIKSKALIIRTLSDEDFINVLDDNVDIVTETTINKLHKKLNIENTSDNSSNIVEKTNNNQKNEFEIINKILSLNNSVK